eukprot:TRINITY_DN2370_c0_g1_i1.p1 TRINITY_DN2370_c0_g1~~TRINITY_DN2370_c0_g1_i1.p1  ORF type:complete len:653 (+),score=206.73 TRINITY_DN2370_c0_g1_i1:114-2072(+)
MTSDGARTQFLQDQITRLESVVRVYQQRYPLDEPSEDDLRSHDGAQARPWVSNPEVVSPLMKEYDRMIAERDKTIREQEREILELKQQINTLVRDNEHLEGQSHTTRSSTGLSHRQVLLEKENELIMSQNQSLSQRLTEAQDKCSLQQRNINELEATLNRRSQMLDELQAQVNEVIDIINSSGSSLKQENFHLKQRTAELEAQLSSTKLTTEQRSATLQRDNSAELLVTQRAEIEAQHARERVAELTAEVDELRNQLRLQRQDNEHQTTATQQAAEERAQHAAEEASELRKRLFDLQNVLDETRASKQLMASDLAASQQDALKSQQALHAFQQQHERKLTTAVEDVKERHRTEVGRLRNALNQSQKEVVQLGNKLETMLVVKADLIKKIEQNEGLPRSELEQLHAINRDLLARLAEAQQARDRAQLQLEFAEQRLSSMQADGQQARQEHSIQLKLQEERAVTAEHDLDAARAEISAITTRLNRETDQLRQLQQVQSQTKQLLTQEAESFKLQYHQREQQLKQKLQMLQAEKDRAVSELQSMANSRQRSTTAQLEEARGRELRYQAELRQAKAQQARVEAELEHVRRLLDESNREVDRAQQIIDEDADQISALSSQLQDARLKHQQLTMTLDQHLQREHELELASYRTSSMRA